MKKFLQSILFQLVFWLILFATERTVFLLWYAKSISGEGIGFTEVLSVYSNALKLDLSTVSYILLLPFLLLSVRLFTGMRWMEKITKVYVALVIVVYVLICVAEIGLYQEWNTKLSYKALVYLHHPGEVINSMQTYQFVVLSLLWIVQSVFFIYVYNRFFTVHLPEGSKNIPLLLRISWMVLIPVFLFIGMRGGFREIPITASQPYFSKHNILNITAVNPGYNIAFNIWENSGVNVYDPFFKFTDEEALQIVQKIRQAPKDTTVVITHVRRPNIVFVLLESWPADVIESLGGEPGITPEFHQLEEEGLLFTNFYATGNRSQQGNASIYAGLPAIPVTTLADHSEKYDALPSLVKVLNEEGYFTSFYFGGQLIYGNLKSFLMHNEFDLIREGDDFDPQLPRGKLGVHDQYVLQKYAGDLKKMPQPFFSTVFTLSSHSPYDYPGDRPIDWIKTENKFINSVHYTDSCLGSFFDEMKASAVWDSTLFFIMSDHSHLSYKGYPLWSFAYHQIPLLITGGALKEGFAGTQRTRICTNNDIPATVLKQLDLPAGEFVWSRNMLNPYSPEYAFFELNDGFGWKRPYGDLVKSVVNKWYYQKNAPVKKRSQLEKEGYAYVQVLLKEFLSY